MEEKEIIENNETVEENTDEVINLTNEELIEKLNKDLEEQKIKTDEYFEHLKRNMAEFDNYKKRVSKEKESLYSTITSDIISDLLPIMDNFNTALQADSKDLPFKEGMQMIYNQVTDTLKKLGLEEIEALNKEVSDLKEALLRNQAELQNYKRRKDEETDRLQKYKNEELIKELLPIVDNFERAIKMDDNDLSDEVSKFLSGFKLIYGNTVNILNKYDVKEILVLRDGEKQDANLDDASEEELKELEKMEKMDKLEKDTEDCV